jgi:phosphoglycerate dehydrogenase-like enzyme
MTRPRVVVLSGETLFRSFFDPPRERRLSRRFDWTRAGGRRLTPRLRRLLAGADALVTTWDSPRFDETLLSLAPRLRMVAHCGGEVKGRFARPLFARLVIANAPGPMAFYVAELALTFLLHAARRLDDYREALRRPTNRVYARVHARGAGEETLRGRTIGLLGFGRIGRELAWLLKPFGARLLVHDPYVPAALARRHAVERAGLERVLRECDLLVLAAALTDETRGLLDARRLALLKDGTTVVNVARGGLLDLAALTHEVRRGRLRCALDVSDPHEPLPLRHPLRRMRGAVVTPHVGAGALAVRRQMADTVLAQLEGFFRDGRVANRVSAAQLERMT